MISAKIWKESREFIRDLTQNHFFFINWQLTNIIVYFLNDFCYIHGIVLSFFLNIIIVFLGNLGQIYGNSKTTSDSHRNLIWKDVKAVKSIRDFEKNNFWHFFPDCKVYFWCDLSGILSILDIFLILLKVIWDNFSRIHGNWKTESHLGGPL